MHQEKEYPGRVFGTDLKNPDFAMFARSFGADGFTIEDDKDAIPVMEKLFASKAAVVHVKIATDAITPSTTLTALREKALKKGQGTG
jgi:acetolactate synthase-1/2/3 large subunit